MTNQQKPEALRLADEFKLCNEYDSIPSINDIDKAEAELRRLNAENERLAALVDAQQPAPSAVVALSDGLRDGLVAISKAIADQDDRTAQAMLREILAAPQPTPPARAPADSVQEDAADPLQGAANWLAEAHGQFCVAVLQGCLMIGYNRAKRLHDVAIAARKQGANHD